MKKLFCVPGGGTTSILFIQWQKYLKELLKVEYMDIPGRGYMNRKKEEKTMSGIGRSLAEEVARKTDEDGYSIFGYCFGAVAAYEICLEMKRMQLPPPDHFYVCGSYSPSTRERIRDVLEIKERRNELIRMFYHMFPSYLFKDPELQKKICSRYMEIVFCCFDRDRKLETVDFNIPEFDDLREQDSDAVEYVVTLANRYFDEYQKDGSILVDYCNSEKDIEQIDAPITLIYGNDDDIIGEEWKEWEHWTQKEFYSIGINTDHFSLIDESVMITDLIRKTESGK